MVSIGSANNLKKIRNERGVSQLKLAFMTGISPSEISRIENGWRRPYPGWKTRLAMALGTSERELFPEEDSGDEG